jgi:hypothetical protein
MAYRVNPASNATIGQIPSAIILVIQPRKAGIIVMLRSVINTIAVSNGAWLPKALCKNYRP